MADKSAFQVIVLVSLHPLLYGKRYELQQSRVELCSGFANPWHWSMFLIFNDMQLVAGSDR